MGRLFCALLLLCAFVLAGAVPLSAEPPWKDDFARLCGQTEVAGQMSSDELRALVQECDALLETIRKTDIPSKKVYVFRLEKCRNFYRYLLSLKDRE